MSKDPQKLGEIVQWPGGYAMSLGLVFPRGTTVTCCPGHQTPRDAKSHGLVRLVEIASAVADRDIAVWASLAEKEAEAPS